MTYGKSEWLQDLAAIQQRIDAIPWAMPLISPPAPTTSTTTTQRTTIPANATTYAASGRKYSGVPLGFKLEGTDINIDGLTLQDIELVSSNVGFRSYGSGRVRNALVERMKLATGIWTSGIPSGLIYSQGTELIDAVFRNLVYYSTQGVADGSAIVGAFVLAGKGPADIGENILLENFDFRGPKITGASSYPNSDGVSIESGYNGVLVRNGQVYDVSDGCFDIKSERFRVDNISGELGRQTCKFWNPNSHGAIYSISPRFAHLLLTRENQGAWAEPMVIEHLNCRHASGTQPIFRMEDGTRHVIVKSHDLSGCKPGTPLISKDSLSGASTVTWEQGTPGNGVTL